jgi:glycosyltransferase involved in cell wall biosynthesis
MRIAMLSWETLHAIAVGGVAAHVTELAAALAAQGHEVHVFTRIAEGQADYEVIDNVHYHRCPYPGARDFVEDVDNMCRAFVHRVFDTERELQAPFDVIHAHDWLAANAMVWIKKGRGHPCVLTIHSTDFGRAGNVFHNGESQRIREREHMGAHWADRLITVSQALKNEVLWMYEVPSEKITPIYNGVEPERFDIAEDLGELKRGYDLGPTDPTVLFCGRLTAQKGPDLLLEAIPAALEADERCKFVFAGDGDMRGQLEQRAAELGMQDAVRVLGRRGGHELAELFHLADMVAVPSRNEPFGIVVLEAWSACTPVVATHNGGPGEFVWHEVNGLKIYPNPHSVAWGVCTLLRSPEWGVEMGKHGRRAVDAAFRWERIAEQTLRVYDPAAWRNLATSPTQAAVEKAETDTETVTEVAAESTSPTSQWVSESSRASTEPTAMAEAERADTRSEEAAPQVCAEVRLCDGAGDRAQADLATWAQAAGHSGAEVAREADRLLLNGDLERVLTAVRYCHQLAKRSGHELATAIRPAEPSRPDAGASLDRPPTRSGGARSESSARG